MLAGKADSVVSRLDPRVKLILLLVFIGVLSQWTWPSGTRLMAATATLVALTLVARLSLTHLLMRGLLVLPFVGFFAFVIYFSGQPGRALLILEKSYLSSWSVLLVVSSTAPGKLIAAAHSLRVPSLLSEVTQLTFRYLFVLRDEATAIQTAFQSRAGRPGMRALLASSGMIAGLFMRSQERSERIHHAMLSRGYSVERTITQALRARPVDYLVLAIGILVLGSTIVL